jgi:hypothetical protein
MKYTYEELENVIVRTDKNGNISNVPKDPANSDYQRYLRWLENPDADESGTL